MTSWTGFVSAKGLLRRQRHLGIRRIDDRDKSPIVLAFLAMNDPRFPGSTSRYVATLSASAAFTVPLQSTVIWLTICLLLCVKVTLVNVTRAGPVGADGCAGVTSIVTPLSNGAVG